MVSPTVRYTGVLALYYTCCVRRKVHGRLGVYHDTYVILFLKGQFVVVVHEEIRILSCFLESTRMMIDINSRKRFQIWMMDGWMDGD